MTTNFLENSLSYCMKFVLIIIYCNRQRKYLFQLLATISLRISNITNNHHNMS